MKNENNLETDTNNSSKPLNEAAKLKGRSGLKRLVSAGRYTMRGLKAAFKNEEAFRQECLATAILVPAALYLPLGAAEKALLCSCVLLVGLVELINTAIEAAIDRIGTELHPLSAQAKDLGSAAVFVSVVIAVLTWAVILAEEFF